MRGQAREEDENENEKEGMIFFVLFFCSFAIQKSKTTTEEINWH